MNGSKMNILWADQMMDIKSLSIKGQGMMKKAVTRKTSCWTPKVGFGAFMVVKIFTVFLVTIYCIVVSHEQCYLEIYCFHQF
jgi:hypothetical protein